MEQKLNNKRAMIEDCCICLESFNAESRENLIETKCEHLFHYRCLKKWCESKVEIRRSSVKIPDCPSCRVKFEYVPE